MLKESKSGLFEMWLGVLIEGDCYTPSKIHYWLEEIFPTSEALAKAECSPKYSGCEMGYNRYPKDFVKRHEILQARKKARRIIQDDTPF
jgi:hypothetical protein